MSIIIPEPQRRLHQYLTDICHDLPVHVRKRNSADTDGAAVARKLADHRAAHPEFDRANTHQTTRWAAMLGLSVVAWICDFVLVSTFAAFLVSMFIGGAR